jgi:hypothetical protein
MVHNTQQQNFSQQLTLFTKSGQMAGKQLSSFLGRSEVAQGNDSDHVCSFRRKMVLLLGHEIVQQNGAILRSDANLP